MEGDQVKCELGVSKINPAGTPPSDYYGVTLEIKPDHIHMYNHNMNYEKNHVTLDYNDYLKLIHGFRE